MAKSQTITNMLKAEITLAESPDATRSASLTVHATNEFNPGQIITIQGVEYEIETVKPTRIREDEYGRQVDWPGIEISAVSPPSGKAGQLSQELP